MLIKAIPLSFCMHIFINNNWYKLNILQKGGPIKLAILELFVFEKKVEKIAFC